MNPACELRYGTATDAGRQRTGNEDAVYASPRVLAVADGMGGHAEGEVASSIVVEALGEVDTAVEGGTAPLTALNGLAETILQRLQARTEDEPDTSGMGSTMTAMVFDGAEFVVAHVGDSRAYLLREGELRALTRDHTLVQALVDDGSLTEEEAAEHPRRSVLVRALQADADTRLDLSAVDVRPGDRCLLCSDGLTDVVATDTIAATLGEGQPSEVPERLVALANDAGGPDNISVVVAEVRRAG